MNVYIFIIVTGGAGGLVGDCFIWNVCGAENGIVLFQCCQNIIVIGLNVHEWVISLW